MKYYLIVGEASGDLHASRLMRSLKKIDEFAEFRFFGGDLMAAEGGTRVKHFKELAYMGFVPVLLHLGTIFSNMKRCKEDIVKWKPDSGKVYAAGEDVGEADLIRLRRKIGYVIQNKGLFPHMTVEKNIIYVPVISGQKDKRQNRKLAEELIGLVGLEREMLDRYPEELSGGQQQRVGIARALASRPKLLLMDEPFGALDEITKRAMQNELLALQKKLGMTVVFITHDIREAMKLGDRVLVMEQGKIAQCDTPENVKKNPADEFVKELIG